MRHRRYRCCRGLAVALLAMGLLFGVTSLPTPASAQISSGPDNPAADTISKRPYVLMLMDSSASMEWTQNLQAKYPQRDYGAFGIDDPYPEQPSSWQSGRRMGIDDSGEPNAADWNNKTGPDADPLMFGPCFVWEPACTSYERPSWKIDEDWTEQYKSSYPMGQRLEGTNYMRGNTNRWNDTDGTSNTPGFPVRLLNFNQPRHVTFKEILTGEMVMYPEDTLNNNPSPSSVNFRRYGPGCWFVPRQRGASNVKEPVCCKSTKTVTQPDGTTDTVCTDGYADYERYPDHKDPRPHFQEVYDAQLGNGLMDNLNEQMHFSVTTFDSYKFRMDGDTHFTNSKNSLEAEDTVLWKPHEKDPLELSDVYSSSRTIESDIEGDYNLGVYRIVGPEEFPSSESDMKKINRLSQTALRDTGTLKAKAYQSSSQTKENPDFIEDPKVGSNASSVLLGRQPVARNTPLGPAIHDIHDFFRDGDGPVKGDRFKQCRPKHVVMMTDGQPKPEAPANYTECVEVDDAGLSETFQINKNQYDYKCTEKMISEFVTDSNISVNSARFDPRVHIVGINQRNWSKSTDKPDSVDKLASMAVAGKTCAGWYLGNRTQSEEDACGIIQPDDGKGPWIPDFDGNSSNGYCSKPEHPCLVRQYPRKSGSGSTISPPKSFSSFGAPSQCPPSGWQGCEYPGIVLTCNSVSENETYFQNNPSEIPSGMTASEAALAAYRECRSGKWSSRALQQIFNSILQSSGLASRTQASVTNELDDSDKSVSGQYRFYSGVRVETGQPVWRGVLFRERRLCKSGDTGTEQISQSDKDSPCDPNNDVYNCFHRDVGDQIERDQNTGEATADNRRIFTSVPEERAYDYEDDIGKPAASGSCGLYHTTYLMESDDQRGEFQKSYLDTSSSNKDDQILNRRVPVSEKTLSAALVGQQNTDDGKPIGDPDPDGDSDESDDSELHSYFNLSDPSGLTSLLQSVRAQVDQREGSELGAILNSSPVTVPPPKRDVPISSYRDFKEQFSDRPTMLYFATLDGMLHASHTGVLDGKVRQRTNMQTDPDSVFSSDPYGNLSSHETSGSAEDQREAWSYLPHMLQPDLSKFQGVNPNLMDSTPAVKNVRLCDEKLSNNQNFQACRVLCDNQRGTGAMCGSNTNPNCVPKPMQWRTVLVQGLGQAGSGYFALDVTRPGGPHTDSSGNSSVRRPDPIPLWEFSPAWEQGQVDYMINNDSQFESTGESLVFPPSGERTSANKSTCSDDEYWKQPFMGESVSEPAIGTVVLPPSSDSNNSDTGIRRPIAVFGGGDYGSYGTSNCNPQSRIGKAIYVVDLQTGSILRRFNGYRDQSGDWQKFDSPVVGSPALYKSQPGQLTSRGFVGDASGRMFRIEFGDERSDVSERWNPANWQVSLYFDPSQGGEGGNCDIANNLSDVSAAHLTPAVAENQAGNPVVVFGLGDPGDTPSRDQAHTMLAVEETIKTRRQNRFGECLWRVGQDQTNGLRDNEKVTGEPVIFNNAAYFTTYYLNSSNVCERGNSRIWGVEFGSSGGPSSLPTGVFNCSSNPKLANLNECKPRYFEPDNNAVVRGLTITLGPACNAAPGTDTAAKLREGDDQEPQLIVQTGGSEPGTNSSGSGSGGSGSGGGAGASDFVHRMSVGLQDNYRRTVPMSWSVVN